MMKLNAAKRLRKSQEDIELLAVGSALTLADETIILRPPVKVYAFGDYEGRQVFYTYVEEDGFCRLIPTEATNFIAEEGKWLIGEYVSLSTSEQALAYEITAAEWNAVEDTWYYTLTNYGRTGEIDVKNVKASAFVWSVIR